MDRNLYEAEHDDYRRSVKAFMEREVVPHYADWEKAGIVPKSLFTGLGDLGAFASVPEEYGGSGLHDFRYNAIISEESAVYGVGPALLGPTLQADICMPYLLDLTTEEQKARWLPKVATGEYVVAIAMTEPGAGSDLSGIRTKAVRDGDDYIVNGTKTFITNGINADLVITVVRTGDHPHKGLSLLVIEDGTPGFSRGRNLEKVGMHSQDTAELFFNDAKVPVENLLRNEGEGFKYLVSNLAQERMSIAIAAVGVAEAALVVTLEYVQERKAFGQSIGSFQVSRHALADCRTEIDVAQAFIDQCIRELGEGTLTPERAAEAKLFATELQGRVTDRCVQLHGGYGYMTEYAIARMYADARVTRIYGGASEIMKEIIGKSLGV